MAYKVYTTSAFLLGSRDTGESSRVYYLFTRELGLVHAYARSVRELRGKLRMHLEGGTYIKVTLVLGKEYWRIIGVEEMLVGKDNFYHARAYSGVFSLLSRFVGVEDIHVELFDELADSYIQTTKLVWPSLESDRLESMLSLRALDRLGYVAKGVGYGDRAEIMRAINQALNVSHL